MASPDPDLRESMLRVQQVRDRRSSQGRTARRAPPDAAVATERCTWRGRVLKGEVHDGNAVELGGAAGHAGLFGSVVGVLDFAVGLLDGSGASPAMLAGSRCGPRQAMQ